MSWVFIGIYESMGVTGISEWVYMGFYGGTYRFLWISGCLWVFMGVSGLLGFRGFIGTYGCHEYLWVLYLNIKNITHFLIQEPIKIAYAPWGRGTLSTLVFFTFQYSSPAPDTHSCSARARSLATRTGNSYSYSCFSEKLQIFEGLILVLNFFNYHPHL